MAYKLVSEAYHDAVRVCIKIKNSPVKLDPPCNVVEDTSTKIIPRHKLSDITEDKFDSSEYYLLNQSNSSSNNSSILSNQRFSKLDNERLSQISTKSVSEIQEQQTDQGLLRFSRVSQIADVSELHASGNRPPNNSVVKKPRILSEKQRVSLMLEENLVEDQENSEENSQMMTVREVPPKPERPRISTFSVQYQHIDDSYMKKIPSSISESSERNSQSGSSTSSTKAGEKRLQPNTSIQSCPTEKAMKDENNSLSLRYKVPPRSGSGKIRIESEIEVEKDLRYIIDEGLGQELPVCAEEKDLMQDKVYQQNHLIDTVVTIDQEESAINFWDKFCTVCCSDDRKAKGRCMEANQR